MHVIRQDDEGIDIERIAQCLRDRVAQQVDVIDEKRPLAFEQIDGEKPASAGNEAGG